MMSALTMPSVVAVVCASVFSVCLDLHLNLARFLFWAILFQLAQSFFRRSPVLFLCDFVCVREGTKRRRGVRLETRNDRPARHR